MGNLSLSVPALPPYLHWGISADIALTVLEEGFVGLQLGPMVLLQICNGGGGAKWQSHSVDGPFIYHSFSPNMVTSGLGISPELWQEKQLLCSWWPEDTILSCNDSIYFLSIFHSVLSTDGAFLFSRPPIYSISHFTGVCLLWAYKWEEDRYSPLLWFYGVEQ